MANESIATVVLYFKSCRIVEMADGQGQLGLLAEQSQYQAALVGKLHNSG